MKRIFLVASFFCIIGIYAQTAENLNEVIPTVEVQKAFQKDFPNVKPVWRKEFTGADNDQLTYEADFTLNNDNMTAVYSAIGVFKVLEFEIKPTEIPASISSYLEKNYPKNKIEKAARMMTSDNKITYEIGITIDGKWIDAVFDKEGDFLEMVQKDN